MQEQCSNVAVEMLESAPDKLAWNSADTRTYNQHRLYTSIMYHVCGVQIEIFYPVEIKNHTNMTKKALRRLQQWHMFRKVLMPQTR